MNTINALTAITPLGSSTSDSGNRQQSQQHAKPGQFLTATVLESTDSKQFYIEILGKKILAKGDSLTLSPGAKLKLEILATTPDLKLRIVSQNPEMFFGKTLTLLSKNLDISVLFQNLQTPPSPLLSELSSLSQKSLTTFFSVQQAQLTTTESGVNLKQLLNQLGLNRESLLASGNKQQDAALTLKSALLEIRSLLKSGSDLAKTTNKLLGTIELYQLAQLRLSNENLLIFPLPLSFLNHGYLLVDKDPHQENSNEGKNHPRRFSLHLNLEPLGNLEILFLDTPDGLYIRFCCDTQEKSLFASSQQDVLKQMISSTNVLGLSFGEDAGNPAQALVQQLIPDGEAMLDTKI
jgi:hypothetical protein